MSAKNFVFGFVLSVFVAVNAQCDVPLDCQPLVGDLPAPEISVPAPEINVSAPEISVPAPVDFAPSQVFLGVSSCGPYPNIAPIRQLEPLIMPAVDGPIFVLPSPPPPPPTVISNKCQCSKTVLKPQLYQRVIQVQKNQRFIKKSFKPVVEKIHYCAKPRC